MATQTWVNSDSDNGLLPGGIKPLPDTMLTYTKGYLWYSTEINFAANAQDINP